MSDQLIRWYIWMNQGHGHRKHSEELDKLLQKGLIVARFSALWNSQHFRVLISTSINLPTCSWCAYAATSETIDSIRQEVKNPHWWVQSGIRRLMSMLLKMHERLARRRKSLCITETNSEILNWTSAPYYSIGNAMVASDCDLDWMRLRGEGLVIYNP